MKRHLKQLDVNWKKRLDMATVKGVTKGVALQLAEVTGGTLHEIKPELPYTDADLDWRDKQSRSSVEVQDKSSRPAIKDKLTNMQDYDVIYVGFPIWWYTCPTIINTFLEAYDLTSSSFVATRPFMQA